METRTVEHPIGEAELVKRIALGLLPGPFGRRGRRSVLPELVLQRNAVAIDRAALAAYDRVCGFAVGDVLPATYLHNVTFPLAIELMTDGTFPYPPLGMVHLANTITQLRPVGADERPDVRLWASDLEPHNAGMQFRMNGEASIDGEVVWRDESLYLAPGARNGAPPRPRPQGRRRRGTPPAPQPEAIWPLPADIGRRFAAVSGDRNPIHLSSLGARAFGMPSAIAHGMYLKARCLAALSAGLPDAFTIEVRFRRPARLPSRVGFSTAVDGGVTTFAVHELRRGTPHVLGTLRPA